MFHPIDVNHAARVVPVRRAPSAPVRQRRPLAAPSPPPARPPRALVACRGGESAPAAPHAGRLARHLRPALARSRALHRRPDRPRRRLPLRRTDALHPRRARRSRPRHELGRLARRADLHLPPAPRRQVPRRHAVRRRARCVASWQRVLDPAHERRPRLAALSRSAAPRTSPTARRQSIAGLSRAERLAPSSSRSRSRSRSFPSCSRCRSRRSSPTRTRRTSASTPSAPGRGSSSSGSTTTTCSSREPRRTGAAPEDRLARWRASSPSRAPPSPSSRPATSTCSTSRSGDAASWEETDEKKQAARSPRRRSRFCTSRINTTRGPLADARVRQALNYADRRRTTILQQLHRRPRHARRRRDPADRSTAPTRSRKRYPHDVAKAQAAARRRPAIPNGIDVELWVVDRRDHSPRIAQTIQAYLAEAGIRAKIVQRDASSVREAARKGETDIALKDWFADYPDAENFLYPLLHSANKGVGGNVSFYANPQFDSLVDHGAPRAGRSEARRALPRRPISIAFDDAPMVYLFFYKELYAVQPWISGFKVPADLQRPALDRRDAIERDSVTRRAMSRFIAPAARCSSIPTLLRRAGRRVPAALRRARRSGAGDGRRARRRRRPSRACATSSASTSRCPSSSRTTPAACCAATSARSYITSRPIIQRHPRALPEDAAARRRGDAARLDSRHHARRAERAQSRRLVRPPRARRRLPRDLVPRLLGRAAAHPALRGDRCTWLPPSGYGGIAVPDPSRARARHRARSRSSPA